jgi:hypothetical protein
VANLNATVLTIIADERKLRALVRNSVRISVAMTRYEERRIEDEFIRLARKQKRPGSMRSEVSHGQ